MQQDSNASDVNLSEDEYLQQATDLLNKLSSKPYDYSLHAQHVQLAIASNDAEQIIATGKLMTSFWLVGDEVWLPILDAKLAETPLDAELGLELLEQAEANYLSIPILERHMDFLISNCDSTVEQGGIHSISWTRSALDEVLQKGLGHLTEDQRLWEKLRDWELEQLQSITAEKRRESINRIESLHINRLQHPHSQHEDTFQSYSSFTTNHKPSEQYEATLVSASKLRAKAVEAWRRREQFETALETSNHSTTAYISYIKSERRKRTPDSYVLKALFERALAVMDKLRFRGDPSGELALIHFWTEYCDFLWASQVDKLQVLEVTRRAVRSVPNAGEIWAYHMRALEHIHTISLAQNVEVESVADVYNRALEIGLVQNDVDQLVPLCLARATYEKRKLESGDADDTAVQSLIEVIEHGINVVYEDKDKGDLKLRLEKFLANLYDSILNLSEEAAEVWSRASKKYKKSYTVWLSYTDLLIKQGKLDEARKTFDDVSTKQIDWPEVVFEAWTSFEHLYGTLDSIGYCYSRIWRAQGQLNDSRAKQAEQARLIQQEYQHASVAGIDKSTINEDNSAYMQVDDPDRGVSTMPIAGKRHREEDEETESHKKSKVDGGVLKRDRENCTIFITGLPESATEEDLRALFKDCGEMREIKIKEVPSKIVCIEFIDRDSVPAALTKDKKRIKEKEICVNLAWKSTLYVTNFPAAMDDGQIRQLFGKFGSIFDIRWPSKKYKSTRRFCYVQFSSPESAEAALSLHGQCLESGQPPIEIYISDPTRKKERSDTKENEIYVAGLSKFVTADVLKTLFSTYGSVMAIRMPTDEKGLAKGYAFVEFDTEVNARKALQANNHELKNRRIAVTLADTRVTQRQTASPASGQSRQADTSYRSVRLKKLPAGTEEGLLQQTLEKYAKISRVEVFADEMEAVVELVSAADAGKLLMIPEGILFNGARLVVTENTPQGASKPSASRGSRGDSLFVPRAAMSRRSLRLNIEPGKHETHTPRHSVGRSEKKGQDDFRKMLQ